MNDNEYDETLETFAQALTLLGQIDNDFIARFPDRAQKFRAALDLLAEIDPVEYDL
jgi:hypothetical protein